MSLTRAQRRFLALHAATPAPHRWAWIQANGNPSVHPADNHRLRAWRFAGPGGKLQVATISRDELKALEPCFDPFPKVSAAVRLLIQSTPRQGQSSARAEPRPDAPPSGRGGKG